jgi:excisionase family DNA binding protein
MAGMFYSLREAAKKLGISEEQVKGLVREGRLREFRDGSNVLFKVDEVESLTSDTSIIALKKKPEGSEDETDEDEISLKPETTGGPAAGGELTDADTAVAGKGINVLGETNSGYQLTEDTMAETKGVTEETSLEKIEEDVSLDTFGSGSGLLDLSLQADDTSLGGILDEIYTPEAGEGKEASKEGSAMEVAAEAEQMLPEEALAGPQPAAGVPAVAQIYVESEADVQSNAFGIMLFLPLLVIVYTAIVTLASLSGVTPAIVEKIQGIIWYIMIGAAVAAVAIVGAAFVLGSKGDKTAKKEKVKSKKIRGKQKDKEAPSPTPEDKSV